MGRDQLASRSLSMDLNGYAKQWDAGGVASRTEGLSV